MKRSSSIAFALAAALLAGCRGATDASEVVSARLEQNFDLYEGQSAAIRSEGIVVRFDEVLEDTRCPEEVVCGTAGNARIRVTAHRGSGGPEVITLSYFEEDGESGSYGLFGSYYVYLGELRPGRRLDAPRPRYRATLLVSRQPPLLPAAP
jgi:hypothetical protein